MTSEADALVVEEGAITAHEGVDPLTRRALDKLGAARRTQAIQRGRNIILQ